MKNIFKILLIILSLSSCGSKEFNELSNNEKKEIIKKNIEEYYKENKNKIEIKNYDFLITQSNKLKPCLTKPLKDLKVHFGDNIFGDCSLMFLASHEYLDNDKELGEINSYGIEFYIDENTGAVKHLESFINFTIWDDGEIGARNSLGSEIVSYEDGKVIDIEKTYLNDDLIKKVNEFYETEMKEKQAKNKSKCN